MQLTARNIWLALNAATGNSFQDRGTNATPVIPKGNVVKFRCAAFWGDTGLAANLITDFTGVLSATFVMRAGGPTGGVMATKTIPFEDFDNPALTFADWKAKTAQLFTVTLTSEENNFVIDSGTERRVYLAFQFDTAAGPILLGKGMAVFFDDGLVDAGIPTPEESEPPFLNMAQSDARYGRPGINVPHYLAGVTAYTGGGDDALDALTTVDKEAGYLVTFDHTDDGLRHYILRAGTAAEDLPDIIRPNDYDTDDNAKYWQSR